MEFRPAANPDDAPRISIAQLRGLLEQDEPVVLLDVRRHPDERQIPASVRVEPTHFLETFNPSLPARKDQVIVAYCA